MRGFGRLLPWNTRRSRRVAFGAGVALVCLLVIAVPEAASAVNVTHPVVVSDDPVNSTPHVLNGRVLAIARVGSRIVVGGEFTRVRNANTSTVLDRTNLFAFDASTGQISTSFAPQIDGSVQGLAAAPGGTGVYAVGAFRTVNGQTARRAALLDVSTGSWDDSFEPDPNAIVKDVVVRGPTVYLAGDFSRVGGVPRRGLAAVDAATGDPSSFLDVPFTEPRQGATPSVRKIDVTPDGARLVAIGNFTRADGESREQIAIIELDTNPATLGTWQTDRYAASACSTAFDTYMRDVDISSDGSYFAVVTSGAYSGGPPVLCDTVARWETDASGPSQQPTWVDYSGGDTLTSVAITGSAIYVGGHQRWMNNPFVGDAEGPGAVERPGIAAVDPANGMPFSWNPGRARGAGAFALVATARGLYVGSDTETLGGETHQRLGMFPVSGGTRPPTPILGSLPGQLFRVDTAGAFSTRGFDGASLGAPQPVPVSLSSLRGAMMLTDDLYQGDADGRFYVRPFDGSNLGPRTRIPTRELESRGFVPQSLTGLFYDRSRIYYTIAGRDELLYRYFAVESNILGAEEFVATTGGGVDWEDVEGMTLASDSLIIAIDTGSGPRKRGKLYRVDWAQGVPSGPLTQIGGAGVDGVDWRSLALFVLPEA